ncbi:MAG: Abi family protein [Coriobacteriales bacterium]|nr:Abi family protein [Coriobacteriales bacterium]
MSTVSYHCLSGYWRLLRIETKAQDSWLFPDDTRFSCIWDRYVFDRQLRLMVLDAIKRISIAPQSRWAERLESLFALHPQIDRKLLGYPDNWHDCPIWSDVKPADETV